MMALADPSTVSEVSFPKFNLGAEFQPLHDDIYDVPRGGEVGWNGGWEVWPCATLALEGSPEGEGSVFEQRRSAYVIY